MTYNVVMIYSGVVDVLVDAENEDQAIDKAYEKCESGELHLHPEWENDGIEEI